MHFVQSVHMGASYEKLLGQVWHLTRLTAMLRQRVNYFKLAVNVTRTQIVGLCQDETGHIHHEMTVPSHAYN